MGSFCNAQDVCPFPHPCVMIHVEHCQPGKVTLALCPEIFIEAALCRHDRLIDHVVELSLYLPPTQISD